MIQSEENASTSPPTLTRPFWLLWGAFVLSNLADGLNLVVLPLLILDRSDAPLAVAGLSTALTLPWLILALPVGVMLDRVDRRAALIAANGVRVAVIAVLGVVIAIDAAGIAVLYAVAIVLGCAEVIYDTASQTMLPRVVAPGLLERANGRLFAGEVIANRFVGPPVGGVLIAATAVVAVSAPAAAWLIALGLLSRLPGTYRPQRNDDFTGLSRGVRADLIEGLRYLWGEPTVCALTVVVGVVNLALSGMLAVFVVFAVGDNSTLGLTETHYGLILGSLAVGAVVGALNAGRIVERLGRTVAMTAGVAAIVLLMVALALTSCAYIVAVALALAGSGSAVFSVTALSLRQQIVPDEFQGRTTAGYRFVSWGSAPIGAFAAGLIGQVAGLRTVFWIAAALCAIACAATPIIGRHPGNPAAE